MSVRDQLLKLQKAVDQAEASSVLDAMINFPTVTGFFETRKAQFGVRQVRGYTSEIFYKVKLKKSLELPLWLKDYCPVKLEEHVAIQKTPLRIESTQWLTERHRLLDKEAYFESQTPELVREHFHALAGLAERIETGTFSLEKSIEAFQEQSFRDFLIMLGMYFVGIVVIALIVLNPCIYNLKKYITGSTSQQEASAPSRGNAVPQYNKARLKAEEAAHLRKIVPSNPNIFLRVTPDKTTVRCGERVTLTYAMFTRYRTKYWGLSNEGQFEGFQVEKRSEDKKITQEMVQEQGKKYMRVVTGEVTLLAVKPGGHFLYPGSAFVSAVSNQGEIMDMYLLGKKIPITVQKAPEKNIAKVRMIAA